MKQIKSSLNFIWLHSVLLYRLYILDSIFFAVTIWYIVFDITVDDPFRPVIFLFMFCIFFIALNMNIVRENMGGVYYYKVIPFRGFLPILVSHGIVFIPFTVTILLSVFFICMFGLPCDTHKIITRTGHILSIYYSIKLVTVPLLLLVPRHPAVLFGFFFMIIPIVVLVLMFDEFFWMNLPFCELWGLLQFVMSIFLLELVCIKKCEMR